jgi:hypothetical protein
MIKLLPPETLAWLRLAASCGQPDAQLTLHILERLEALEKRPIPTPEAPPVATDNGLVRCYAQAVEDALKAGHGIDCAAAAALRAVYNLDRQHGAAQPPAAQPTPPAAPAGTAELAADCSALDARAWAYIGKQAMCGDPAATALIDLLNNPPAPPAAPVAPAAPANGESEYTDTEWAEINRWKQESPAAPPAPPAGALAARPLLEQVAAMADCIGAHTVGEIAIISDRAAAWLRDNPEANVVAWLRGRPVGEAEATTTTETDR